jgi:hypothetical protein
MLLELVMEKIQVAEVMVERTQELLIEKTMLL